jgi:hypothetical protein
LPQWARTSAPPSAELLADVAEWRAAMQVPEADQHPTGPPQISVAAARWQRALDERAASDRSPAMAEWAPLLHTTAPDTARDPFTPELAEQLAAISRTGLDARAILRLATSDGPLPDDHAAAALWWRIQRHLTPDPGDVGAAVDVNAATDAVFDGVTQRWAPLAKRLDPRLTAQRDWLLLAEVLQEVHDAGYDVLEVTRQLVEQAPLDGRPAEDLRYRLAAAVPLDLWTRGVATEPATTLSGLDNDRREPPKLLPEHSFGPPR